jgi:hypothetical protein
VTLLPSALATSSRMRKISWSAVSGQQAARSPAGCVHVPKGHMWPEVVRKLHTLFCPSSCECREEAQNQCEQRVRSHGW